MTAPNKKKLTKRNIGRRQTDFDVLDQIQRHTKLFQMGQIITSEVNLDLLFELIIDQTNQIMNTERSTVFLYDQKTNELWSLVATGMERNEIRIKSDVGVTGWVFQNCTPLIINDAYEDSRFYTRIDEKSNFRTRNILCIPIENREGNLIGTLQTLNKGTGDFKEEDTELLILISYYVAIALENSKLYEEVKDYSKELETTLIRIETLERVKNQLTKFVPTSVVKMAEHDPDKLTFEKIPLDVTIFFIDIQDFSKIIENFDQRLVNDLVEHHFSRYLEIIYQEQGEVNETSGDGLMVIFKDDSPAANAKKAVDAGLGIVTENRRLNKEFLYPWGEVKLHLGINTGEALVGSTKMTTLTGERWTYTASGLVTVLAARIGALSSGTKLYVGPETFNYLNEFYDYEFRGSQEVKNIKKPVPVYWIKGERDSRTSPS